MSTPEVKDLAGRPLQVGDWVVQAHNLGRCAALKFAKVLGFSKAGSLRLVGFEEKINRARRVIHLDGTTEWVTQARWWDRTGPYSAQYSTRSFKISEADLPASLRKFIEDELHGDVLHDPKNVAI